MRRKIDGAAELKSVVRTMKALAAASIGQYEKAVLSLNDYNRTVQLALIACLRQPRADEFLEEERHNEAECLCAFVFGSDQGLVGAFNNMLADYAAATLATKAGKKVVWAVGSRVESCLADAGLPAAGVSDRPQFDPRDHAADRANSGRDRRSPEKEQIRASLYLPPSSEIQSHL